MNNSHETLLEELKKAVDEEFGEEAVWHFADGHTEPVFGTFSLIDKELSVKPHIKRAAQLTVDCISATYAMSPKAVTGKESDTLVVNGQSYLVLPFKPGDFETIIPLKPTQNKTHSWR